MTDQKNDPIITLPFPWMEFLAYRSEVIDYLHAEGKNDVQIAQVLSMDPSQVLLIRTRDRQALALDEEAKANNLAVDRFAKAMKDKLMVKRNQGRRGWQTCPPKILATMLTEHLAKGDPIDVANFAMMLWTLGAPTLGHDQTDTELFDWLERNATSSGREDGWDIFVPHNNDGDASFATLRELLRAAIVQEEAT